uniref:collagen alpha-1(I) chain-like n=1 Tax=Lonchura striata TaxID=40157 RepID=UPI000B4D64B2|nr:collagen alpha-1(I) chain-like [Lonchura striata domestica]
MCQPAPPRARTLNVRSGFAGADARCGRGVLTGLACPSSGSGFTGVGGASAFPGRDLCCSRESSPFSRPARSEVGARAGAAVPPPRPRRYGTGRGAGPPAAPRRGDAPDYRPPGARWPPGRPGPGVACRRGFPPSSAGGAPREEGPGRQRGPGAPFAPRAALGALCGWCRFLGSRRLQRARGGQAPRSRDAFPVAG